MKFQFSNWFCKELKNPLILSEFLDLAILDRSWLKKMNRKRLKFPVHLMIWVVSIQSVFFPKFWSTVRVVKLEKILHLFSVLLFYFQSKNGLKVKTQIAEEKKTSLVSLRKMKLKSTWKQMVLVIFFSYYDI